MLDLNNYKHIKAIHILRNDELIYGNMGNYSDSDLFPVGCIFKTFLSLMVGVAIHERKISSLEDKIKDYYPEYNMNKYGWDDLCIWHALSKTTGIVWPGPGEKIPENMKEVLNLEMSNRPGTEFLYKPDPQLIVYLLEEIYGVSIIELFEDKVLLHYAGINYSWSRENIEGLQVPIKLLDEVGKLYLHKGRIGNDIIFDERYVEDSMIKHSEGGFPECMPYGLGGWVDSYNDIEYYMASGFGGQKLVVIPKKDTVISVVSNMDRPHPENNEIIKIVLDQL